jgi:hypothetical protein
LATNYALAVWNAIVHVTTTRTIGNIKADQNALAISFANLKQRYGESTGEFKRRIMTKMDSFDAIVLDRPRDPDIATRFLYGLDDNRYSSLKIYLGNEAANGRDLYPTDLDSAATETTRWIAYGSRYDAQITTILTFFTKNTASNPPKNRPHTAVPTLAQRPRIPHSIRLSGG